ncbi:MAG: Gldg family protein [Oscillospiraceae bacterium]|nr:Gldg family protein [Oscillospiraceae bacterium]
MYNFRKKLKYGSVAMVFTIVFVAAVFILNVVMTAYNNINPMFIDMTKEQMYGITDDSRELLKDIDVPIEIAFFMPVDLYEKRVSYGKMIVNCIRTFASEYDNITIGEYDIIKTPGIRNEFVTSELSQLSTTSIGVRSQGKARLLSATAFFTMAQSTGRPFAFNGERTLTSAILQAVSMDEPLVLFTMGHSESVPRELVDLIGGNGFRMDAVDLAIDDIPEDAKVLVICNPQKDFIGADPDNPTVRSEIDKVASFLNAFGSVMYFSDPRVGSLPELDDLLKEYGMEFEHGAIIADDRNSLNSNIYNLSADYFEAGNVGDELHASIRRQPSPPRTVVPYAKPINILSNTAGERGVSPVLTSSSSSYRINTEGMQSNQGASNLLVVAQRTTYIDNNPKTSLFLVSGSYEFLGALPNASYSNSDILLNAMRIMTSKRIAVDIKFKLFDSTSLDMTIEQQNRWTLITILVLPSLVSILGIVVWLRRRHS